MKGPDTHLGTVIAERRLHVRGSPRRTVLVSLGRPRPTKGHDDWNCPFRIAGAGIRVVDSGLGVDAFQALSMALEGIRYHLDRSRTPLVLDDMFDDPCFNRVIPLLPDPAETRRIERLVDREVRRWTRMLEERYKARARRARRRPASPLRPTRSRRSPR